MPWIPALVLLPFVLLDAVVFLLRRRGDPSPARRAELLRHFTDEDLAVGRAQALRRLRLMPWGRLLFYGFFGALLFGGLAARLEAGLLGLVGHWAAALPLFVVGLLLAWSLVTLPLEAYAELVMERQAGLSTTTAATFVVDQVKGLVVGAVLASLLAFPVVGLVRWLPTLWPLPAAAAALAITAFATWLAPWVIAPLFNRFWPLEDAALAERLKELVARAGLRVGQVLVTDASRRSTTLNAYFTGLGSSRRVVLYDTLVQACEPDEVLSTVAHELGHWKHHHIAKLFALNALGVLAGLALLALLLASPDTRALLGVPAPGSLALLALLPFIGTLAARLGGPLLAAVSRRFERQADRVALELTGNPRAFVQLEQRLVRRAKADLLVPVSLHRLYGSHPLPEERIRTAERVAGISEPASQREM